MKRFLHLVDETDGGGLPVDPDLSLIAAYVSRELSVHEIMAVEARLRADSAFRERVQFVLDSAALPISFAQEFGVTPSGKAHAPRLTPLELSRQREKLQRKRTIKRVAAIVIVTAIPLVMLAQFAAFLAKRTINSTNAGARNTAASSAVAPPPASATQASTPHLVLDDSPVGRELQAPASTQSGGAGGSGGNVAGAGLTGAQRGTAAQNQPLRTERRVVGDTTVVRTTGGGASYGLRRAVPVFSFGQVSGANEYLFGDIAELERGADGALYLFDRQVPALRKYDSTGRYLFTIGRQGDGPGEYRTGTAGLAITRGGIALGTSDSRILYYTPTGQYQATWTIASRPQDVEDITVFSDTAGAVWVLGSETRAGQTASFFMRLGPDGRALDSIGIREYARPIENIDRRGPGGSARAQFPFQPMGRLTWSNRGFIVATEGDEYSIDLIRPRGRVLRIERDLPPVAISQAERDEAQRIVEGRIRRVEPAFRLETPVPATRPPVRDVVADDDGRIWVLVATPGEKIPEAERQGATAAPITGRPGGFAISTTSLTQDWGEGYGFTFRVPIAYDVFADDGAFLGRVQMPKGVVPRVMKGNFIWAVTRDSLDVQRVTKLRIEPPLAR